MKISKWYEGCYRRNLVDMHIADWDERFMSEFDPQEYVSLMKRSNVQAAMIYVNSHTGLCYWPTNTGAMHKGLGNRDIIAELTSLCRKENIHVIMYYSLIYDNWAYDKDENWRIVDSTGKTSRQDNRKGEMFSGSRYGLCCPNSSGYREYTRMQLKELCLSYDFDGIFFDMTFWPMVCYCESCRERFKTESGFDGIPKTIDWQKPEWVLFQQKREEWMTDFARYTTDIVKRVKPCATVNHQFSPSLHSWQLGVTTGIADASEYCGGDFYGGYIQHSFACKLFNSMSPNMPFEFHTSRCINLNDHTSMKSEYALEIANYTAIAHNGAFLFIDAIDPVGTMNPKVYDLLGEIFSRSMKYDGYLGGKLCSDVAVYFSLKSKMDFSKNGSTDFQIEWSGYPHIKASMGAARTLKENHILYSVISNKNLVQLDQTRVLILPDVLALSEDECNIIGLFVKNGGCVYASGYSGCSPMADIIGIEPEGAVKEEISYIAPIVEEESLLPGTSKKYPLTVRGTQLRVRTRDKSSVRATITLPYTDPSDSDRFASIHSNPPGVETSWPAVVYRKYGKGWILWVAAPIEQYAHEVHRNIFHAMITELLGKHRQMEASCPEVVEILVHHQEENRRFIVNLINAQENMQPVSVHNIRIRLDMRGKKVKKATGLTDEKQLAFDTHDGYVEMTVPSLLVFEMISIEYE